MSKSLIFGHQNPDTDAIGAAIAYSYLQNELGHDTEAVALGAPSEETQFALDYFGVAAPRVIEKASTEVETVMLVDHNEFQQSVADIEDVVVTHVVDHHRIANFQTANPLYYRAEPVGCTSTILFKMFKEGGVTIPKEIAGMLVSAIISDTLLFKSPTCTPEDKSAATGLAVYADIDLEEYGLDMLKAGTNLSAKSEADLLDLDAKSFPMGGKNIRIAQVNTVDLDEVKARKEALLAAMKDSNATNGYDLFILVVTNILTSNSLLIVEGSDLDKVEAAFGVTLVEQEADLAGVVSRKKQVVPPLTNAFA
ncbi:manganese-dependent inorganic pyrophosphatase [Enterococcus nangangensis]|uniref:manganese-dependent inorganic pyrophosphatase n=1 Tax=Enterococcus nangangensis TaxID=2559926 RepID=UPI0010F497FF|nr:manganese-dependent inorganic pyrophosphatase [Enterococcus nangangensis]